MAEHGDEKAVFVLRIDRDRGDLLAFAQPEMCPCFARIRGSVHSIAGRKVRPLNAFAAAYIEHIWIRRCDRNVADRTRRLVVEDRFPGASGVGRFPNAAVIDADVENIWLRRYPNRSDGTAG